jgi:hypothetical protein
MSPLPIRPRAGLAAHLSSNEEAIARSVLYAALFDYPLTLSQLRRTLIGSRQTPSEIVATVRDSAALGVLVDQREGYFFPAGRADLIQTRLYREARSRVFLAAHRPLLRIIAALPYVRFVGLSGSIAHLNMDNGGDLDLFIVTRGRRVWSTAVIVILLAKLLRRRRTLCANFIVSDTALTFAQQDLFTASQLINLKPIAGERTFRDVLSANPFVREFYPNFHAPLGSGFSIHQTRLARATKVVCEALMAGPSMLVEQVCRTAYRAYLRRRASTWASPDQVTLGDAVLKLHTRSHRREVLTRFDDAVHDALD